MFLHFILLPGKPFLRFPWLLPNYILRKLSLSLVLPLYFLVYLTARLQGGIFTLCFCMMCVFLCSVAQSCLTLCDPVDCSLPGSSVDVISSKNTGVGCHFLLQGSLRTTTRTHIACIGRCTFCHWATGQACICMMLLVNRCWMKEVGHKVSIIGQ